MRSIYKTQTEILNRWEFFGDDRKSSFAKFLSCSGIGFYPFKTEGVLYGHIGIVLLQFPLCEQNDL